MKTLLKYSAIITTAAIAVLFSACSVTQSDLAGKINGKPISNAVYMDSYRAHYNNFQILNNRVPDTDEKDQIKLQTWRDATKHIVLTGYFAKYNIEVTMQEVIDSLKNHVPDYILTSAKFKTEGVFDTRIYLQSLEFDTPENLQPVRQQYQNYLIPILKLEKYLIRDELLTTNEKKLASKILRSKADIEWTVIDSRDIEPVISEDEIEIFYQQHSAQFKLDPYYKLNYATIGVKPSANDLANGKALADSLFIELRLGATPEEVIFKRVEGFSQLNYKHAGFIRNNDLDPAVYDLLINMDEGTFSEPVSDAEGLTIYQLEQRTKSMCSYNTLRIPYIPSQSSITLHRPYAERLASLASSIGLTEAAEEMDLPQNTTGKIVPGELWLADTKCVQDIERQIGEQQKGFIMSPIYSEVYNYWLVAELQDNHLNSVKNLEEVRGAITRLLAEDKSLTMAQYQAEQIIAGQTNVPAKAKVFTLLGMSTTSELLGNSAEGILYRTLKHYYLGESQHYSLRESQVWIPRILNVTIEKHMAVSATDINRVFTANLPSNWFDTWMEAKIRQADLRIYPR